MTDTFDVIDLDGNEPLSVSSDDETTCDVCGETLPTNRGMKIHKSRIHGIKSDPPKKTGGRTGTEASKGSGKKKTPLISDSKKFTRQSRELTTDLAAAGVAWMAIRWIESQQIPVPKQDKETFLIPESDRGKMFKPILDGLEQVSPVVKIINTIAERFDYIECFLLWKAYAQTVKEYADARKEFTNDGPSRQSFAAVSEPDDGTGTFLRTVGYSGADFA